MMASGLSRGLTRRRIRPGSAAIRCAGALRGRAHGPHSAAAPDRRKRGTPGDHLGAHRGGVDPTRNRKFESISLQRRVRCEPQFSKSVVLLTGDRWFESCSLHRRVSYTGRSDAETSVLMGMVETGDLILGILTPRYLATWGL